MYSRSAPRRRHDAEFKAKVLAACDEPGASISGVALAHGLNANLVRQWRAGRGVKLAGVAVTPPARGETIETVDVRFRTVGDMTCTCPVESLAANAAEVVGETLSVTVSERGATRMDDRTSDASMERRKREGYF